MKLFLIYNSISIEAKRPQDDQTQFFSSRRERVGVWYWHDRLWWNQNLLPVSKTIFNVCPCVSQDFRGSKIYHREDINVKTCRSTTSYEMQWLFVMAENKNITEAACLLEHFFILCKFFRESCWFLLYSGN